MKLFQKIKKQLIYRRKIAFLHIPKTGGTYINQHESKQKPVLAPFIRLGHSYFSNERFNPLFAPHHNNLAKSIVRSTDFLKSHFVFSIIRNPFSFFVSYLFHAGYQGTQYANPEHYDYDIANKGFEYLLKTIANREDTWPNRKFLFLQLFTNQGSFVPSWLLRQETLDDDLKAMADFYNINYRKKERQRVGGHANYKEFFDDQLVELVYKTWGRELRLYGYEFTGRIKNYPSLSGMIDDENRENVRYTWSSDSLSINGKEISERFFIQQPLIKLKIGGKT